MNTFLKINTSKSISQNSVCILNQNSACIQKNLNTLQISSTQPHFTLADELHSCLAHSLQRPAFQMIKRQTALINKSGAWSFSAHFSSLG